MCPWETPTRKSGCTVHHYAAWICVPEGVKLHLQGVTSQGFKCRHSFHLTSWCIFTTIYNTHYRGKRKLWPLRFSSVITMVNVMLRNQNSKFEDRRSKLEFTTIPPPTLSYWLFIHRRTCGANLKNKNRNYSTTRELYRILCMTRRMLLNVTWRSV